MKVHDEGSAVESLDMSQETLAHIIMKARAFDVLTPESLTDAEMDETDESEVNVLEDFADHPALLELVSAIDDLSDEEQYALVALFWIGRNDFDASEWEEAKQTASERAVSSTANYLAGRPLLADMLEEGAAALGVNLSGIESATMYHQSDRNPKDQSE